MGVGQLQGGGNKGKAQSQYLETRYSVKGDERESLRTQETHQKASVSQVPYKVGTTASPKHSVSGMLLHIGIRLLFW